MGVTNSEGKNSGVITTYLKAPYIALVLGLTIPLPAVLMFSGDVALRTPLKDSFSLLSLVSLFAMIALFYLSGFSSSAVKAVRKADLIKLHKFLGYTCVSVALLHPVMIVLPRMFESGVTPLDALWQMITTFHLGVVLGLCAWGLALVLGVTAFFRKSLPMSYKTWRIVHGLMAGLLVILGAWHAIDLGRHGSLAMIGAIVVFTAPALVMMTKHYRPLLARSS